MKTCPNVTNHQHLRVAIDLKLSQGPSPRLDSCRLVSACVLPTLVSMTMVSPFCR